MYTLINLDEDKFHTKMTNSKVFFNNISRFHFRCSITTIFDGITCPENLTSIQKNIKENSEISALHRMFTIYTGVLKKCVLCYTWNSISLFSNTQSQKTMGVWQDIYKVIVFVRRLLLYKKIKKNVTFLFINIITFLYV